MQPFSPVQLLSIVGISSLALVQSAGRDSPCENLLPGQFTCSRPVIDSSTQAALGCSSNRTVRVACFPVRGIACNNRDFNGSEEGFTRLTACRYVGDKRWDTALALSVFLGMFGIDRFYLGYPAIGLLKLSTFGFFMLGQLIDVVLIASQLVGPADGTDYIIDFYGPRLTFVKKNDMTYFVPND